MELRLVLRSVFFARCDGLITCASSPSHTSAKAVLAIDNRSNSIPPVWFLSHGFFFDGQPRFLLSWFMLNVGVNYHLAIIAYKKINVKQECRIEINYVIIFLMYLEVDVHISKDLKNIHFG